MSISDHTTADQTYSPTQVISNILSKAEQGDFSGLQDAGFIELVKSVRDLDENHYLTQVKARIKLLKKSPISVSDLDRATKPFKPKKSRYEQSEDGGQQRQGKTDLFVELVLAQSEVFCDESGKAYAGFMVNAVDADTGEVLPAHQETWALDSRQFRAKMGKLFYQQYGTVAGESAVKEAAELLTAMADDSPRQEVHLRYADVPDGSGIYVDLANTQREVVEITAVGWRIIPAVDCKVKFRSVQHARPLPYPVAGGDFSLFWDHVNIQGQDSRDLVMAYLLECMRPSTPYPLQEITGGQGCAKSTTQERQRELIDPNAVNLRAAPRSIQDLSVSTISNHMISHNNLSRLTVDEQDFLCVMCTGGGDAGRKLYSSEDEIAYDTKRPVILNGISQLVNRPDLADRTVGVELQKIDSYVDEATLLSRWQEDYPKILGGLYTLLSQALRELPDVQVNKLPRMGDFAKLGIAMMRATGRDDDFIEIFNRNRDDVVRRGIESSPVALALVAYIKAKGQFEGTMSELMAALDDPLFKPKYYDHAAWPKSEKGLGGVLGRLEPAFKVYGIRIERLKRVSRGLPYRISKLEPASQTTESEV